MPHVCAGVAMQYYASTLIDFFSRLKGAVVIALHLKTQIIIVYVTTYKCDLGTPFQ